MAITVGNTQSNTTASGTSVAITKPTGLTVGDGLIAVIYSYHRFGGVTTINTPTGWEAMQDIDNSASADAQRVATFNKVATSDDVSATNFTFTTTGGTSIGGAIMRTIGSRADDIYGVGGTFSNDDAQDSSSYTGLSITPAQDTVLLIAVHAVSSNESWFDSTNPVINGTNPTWTKQYNGNINVFTAPVEATAEITTFSITNTGAGSADTVGAISVIYGQRDASATLTLTQTANSAFAPAGSAGAQTALTLTETTNEAFAPTGKGTSPTRWVNEPKPDTDWINEQR